MHFTQGEPEIKYLFSGRNAQDRKLIGLMHRASLELHVFMLCDCFPWSSQWGVVIMCSRAGRVFQGAGPTSNPSQF